jgi:hypothetical protein
VLTPPDAPRHSEPQRLPRVSVVMAVFNGERYMRESLDSILQQSFTDFEFIIIDDGSTDATAAILEACSDERVRVLRNPQNTGLAESLNRGIAAASGEFIARQDADDISERERMAMQVAFLDDHPDVALVGSAHTEIDAEGRFRAHVDANCNHVTILWAMLFYCPFAHTAVMFRRRPVLLTVGEYDPAYRYSMDYEYWTRISARFRVANLAEPLVRLRMHDASMTATYGIHTREGHVLQVQAAGRLLHGRIADIEATHRVLSALMSGPPSEYEPAQLIAAVPLMLELQQAFAGQHGLSRAEREAHRREVRQHLSNALLAYAHEVPDGPGSGRTVRRLAWHAMRLDPRRLLQPRTAATIAALLAAHHGLEPVTRLLARRGGARSTPRQDDGTA